MTSAIAMPTFGKSWSTMQVTNSETRLPMQNKNCSSFSRLPTGGREEVVHRPGAAGPQLATHVRVLGAEEGDAVDRRRGNPVAAARRVLAQHTIAVRPRRPDPARVP